MQHCFARIWSILAPHAFPRCHSKLNTIVLVVHANQEEKKNFYRSMLFPLRSFELFSITLYGCKKWYFIPTYHDLLKQIDGDERCMSVNSFTKHKKACLKFKLFIYVLVFVTKKHVATWIFFLDPFILMFIVIDIKIIFILLKGNFFSRGGLWTYIFCTHMVKNNVRTIIN